MAGNPITNFMDVSELVKIYKDPVRKSELNTIFNDHFQNEQFKIDRVVNMYNDINVTDINRENRLYFKVTNWNGTTSNSKNSRYFFKNHMNYDTKIEEILNNPSMDLNNVENKKIYDIANKDVGFSFFNLEDLHMYSSNLDGLYIQPLLVPNNIPIVKENEYNFKGSIIKYKSPIVYTLPKIKLGSKESIDLLLNTNQMNEDFLLNYLYCSDDVENLIKFENLYASIDYYMSEKFKNRYIHAYVKRLILQKKYDLLYDKIINNKKIGFGIRIDLTHLFYIFYKHKDNTFVKYLREFFYQKYIDLNKESFDKTIIDINLNNSTEKLKTFLNNNEQIKHLFEFVFEKDGLVSGSFAVKNFTNMNNWNSEDIDIYFPERNLKELETYLNSHYSGKYYSSLNKTSNGNTKYNMQGIVKMIEIHNNPHIQFIIVEDDPWEFIKNQFDFDICMCGIKDNEFLYFHPNLNNFNEARISDMYIRKMVGDLKDNYSVYRAAKTLERSIKYMKRGFHIVNLDHFLHEIEMNMF